MDIPDCNAHCLDNAKCKVSTFYGANSYPLIYSCVLMDGCNSLQDCPDCWTVEKNCNLPHCSAPVEGAMSDNIVKIYPNIDADAACQNLCGEHDDCNFYTYLNSSAPSFGRTCFILSDLVEPLTICEEGYCSTTIANCNNGTGKCGFISEEGHYNEEMLLTETSVVQMLSLGNCQRKRPAFTIVGGGSSGFCSLS